MDNIKESEKSKEETLSKPIKQSGPFGQII